MLHWTGELSSPTWILCPFLACRWIGQLQWLLVRADLLASAFFPRKDFPPSRVCSLSGALESIDKLAQRLWMPSGSISWYLRYWVELPRVYTNSFVVSIFRSADLSMKAEVSRWNKMEHPKEKRDTWKGSRKCHSPQTISTWWIVLAYVLLVSLYTFFISLFSSSYSSFFALFTNRKRKHSRETKRNSDDSYQGNYVFLSEILKWISFVPNKSSERYFVPWRGGKREISRENIAHPNWINVVS